MTVDTLAIRMVSQPNSFLPDWHSWLPSLVAIGIAFIPWKISAMQAKAQRKNFEDQVTAQRELADQQLYASLRSNARLKWVDELRTLVSRFSAAANEFHLRFDPLPDGDPKYEGNKAYQRLIPEIVELMHHIGLYLNQNNASHAALFDAVTEASKTVFATKGDVVTPFTEAILRVTDAAKVVLDAEWNAATASTSARSPRT